MKRKAPKVGDTRIVRRFLLFSLTLPLNNSDDGEVRWLCLSRIIQIRIDCYLSHEWKDKCFV